MTLNLFNTLSREKEQFVPLQKGKAGMYTCGPTVYDYAHIGNFRSYLFADLLRRYLMFKGFKVFQVMNITDVDDKTIRGSRKQGVPIKAFTEKYTKAFFEDMDALRILSADKYTKATEHVDVMITLIQCLLDKGLAYKADDGSVYYKVAAFKDYGKLAHLNVENLRAGASGRMSADEYTKDNVQDFALWKGHTEEDGEVSWDASFGKGRPGWHLECSAMSMHYLGETFDIHTGGVDLIFPHHQNEIAQSEGCTGKKFVKYWLHNEHLLVNGEKMAKSAGNFFTLRDLLKKYEPAALRYLLLSTHYRQQLNFTEENVRAAGNAVGRLQNVVVALQQHVDGKSDGKAQETIDAFNKRFMDAMDDDLNVAEALGALFDFVKDVNNRLAAGRLDRVDAKLYLDALQEANTVLVVIDFTTSKLDADIEQLMQQREEARKSKDFATADKIRDVLNQKGIILEDTPSGIRWKRV